MNLVLLGDLMLGRGVGEEVPRHPPEWFWGDVLPLLREADLVVANLECALTVHREEWRPEEKAFHFRGPPEAVEVLRDMGYDAPRRLLAEALREAVTINGRSRGGWFATEPDIDDRLSALEPLEPVSAAAARVMTPPPR